MIPITIIKFDSQVQLAHLYEHLFAHELMNRLRAQNIFLFIDYTLEASTYYSGFIHLEILCTPFHKNIIEKTIQQIDLSLDEDSVSAGIAQIVAEKRLGAVGDWEKMINDLKTLNDKPWQKLKDINIIQPKLKRKPHSFEISSRHAKTRNLVITSKLDDNLTQSNPQILPLFYVICHALMENSHTLLYGKYGYFVTHDTSKRNIIKYNFRSDAAFTPMLTSETECFKENIQKLIDDDIIGRIISHLTNRDYMTKRGRLDETKIAIATGYLIGSQGWSKLALPETCETIISNIEITFKFGNENSKSLHLKKIKI